MVPIQLSRLKSERNAAFEREAEERLRLETDRKLKTAADERLKVETALRTVELFGAAPMWRPLQRKPPERCSGRSRSAWVCLAPVEELWTQNRIDASGAVSVINKGLEAESLNLGEEASELLRAHAEKLPDGRGGPVAVST